MYVNPLTMKNRILLRFSLLASSTRAFTWHLNTYCNILRTVQYMSCTDIFWIFLVDSHYWYFLLTAPPFCYLHITNITVCTSVDNSTYIRVPFFMYVCNTVTSHYIYCSGLLQSQFSKALVIVREWVGCRIIVLIVVLCHLKVDKPLQPQRICTF
jgi:hypothetical protein